MPQAPKKHNPRGQTTKRNDAYRKSAHERGYDGKWARFARAFIERELSAGRYHCACGCGKNLLGRERSEIHVDHKKPHKGQSDPLFWDVNNLQLMLAACHSRKTVMQDGGFGR